ncbi:MAG: ADP-ribosylglycohydrolase family protein [Clostridia bacterium]|nr:ADP-ribosylglycohydrolase family protein [Clostridia bacterium]
MPGYANYKTLYKEEYACLRDEGYDVEKFVQPCVDNKEFLPFPDQVDNYSESDDPLLWKNAYETLIKVRNTPLREDYPYVEPNDFDGIMKEADNAPELEPLSHEEYCERVKGAFYGRCAAVILGKPLEMGLTKNDIKRYLESLDEYPITDYVSKSSPSINMELRGDCVYSTKGNVKFAQPDDDINYTLLGLLLAEHCYNNGIKKSDVGYNWLNNIAYHWCWCASRQAYHSMVCLDDTKNIDEQIDNIPYNLNPWRECIDGQIRTDIWGYVHPGDIKGACKDAHTDCSFSLTKNGIYGGMFVAGALAGALSKNPTVEKIIASGLASIPKKSRLYEAVTLVCSWWQEHKDWEKVCDLVYEKYGYLPFAATINNMAMVTLGIVAGELDYEKSISIATMCGIDTDCNSGTVGSIVGAAVGFNGIDKKWYEPLSDTIKSTVAAFGECKISDIVTRIIRVKNRINK